MDIFNYVFISFVCSLGKVEVQKIPNKFLENILDKGELPHSRMMELKVQLP